MKRAKPKDPSHEGGTILIIEQGEAIASAARWPPTGERYAFHHAASGKEGLELFAKLQLDIVLVHLVLPDTDGIMLCREIRERQGNGVPFLFLFSDLDAAYCEVEAFRAGADDYLRLPVDPESFRMRLAAFRRRAEWTAALLSDTHEISFGNLRINTRYLLVYLNGQLLDFQRKEAQVLVLLTQSPGRIFSRDQILQEVWGGDTAGSHYPVDVRVHAIRQRIGAGRVETIKGKGYRFVAEPPTEKPATRGGLLPKTGD